jgi:hypothetical protein
VRDRRLLQLERRRILAAVRDLEHPAGAAVVEQERLVALAAEVGRAPMNAEHLRRDPCRLVGCETRWRGLEDGSHRCP